MHSYVSHLTLKPNESKLKIELKNLTKWIINPLSFPSLLLSDWIKNISVKVFGYESKQLHPYQYEYIFEFLTLSK